uniref:Uncharacterized protein n=1 Tax=Kuenenia stuttgartiensis TaxID=174633 RepID=Q1PXP4_KUEST|nr:unknown protein [Candidatus Kuenenia stuttgartiensis]
MRLKIPQIRGDIACSVKTSLLLDLRSTILDFKSYFVPPAYRALPAVLFSFILGLSVNPSGCTLHLPTNITPSSITSVFACKSPINFAFFLSSTLSEAIIFPSTCPSTMAFFTLTFALTTPVLPTITSPSSVNISPSNFPSIFSVLVNLIVPLNSASGVKYVIFPSPIPTSFFDLLFFSLSSETTVPLRNKPAISYCLSS